jgi:hypothetical protein
MPDNEVLIGANPLPRFHRLSQNIMWAGLLIPGAEFCGGDAWIADNLKYLSHKQWSQVICVKQG